MKFRGGLIYRFTHTAFGGKEFSYGSAEVGHVHTGGVVDIPFPRSVHDVLLAGGLAEEHRWVPNSGWITFHVRCDEDLRHARWLMRLSYLRYALKTAPDARKLLEQESHASSRTNSMVCPVSRSEQTKRSQLGSATDIHFSVRYGR